MNDPQSSSSPEPLIEPQAPSGYLVRHNDKIIGIFNDEDSANDALHGYELENNVKIDDDLSILKVS